MRDPKGSVQRCIGFLNSKGGQSARLIAFFFGATGVHARYLSVAKLYIQRVLWINPRCLRRLNWVAPEQSGRNVSALNYHPPAPGLRDFISVYYLFESEGPFLADVERAALAQCRIAVSGAAKMTFRNGSVIDLAPGWHVGGPSSSAVQMQLYGPMQTFGFGILPAGWATLFGSDASAMLDRIVSPQQLSARFAEALTSINPASINPASSLADLAAAADAALAPLLVHSDPQIIEFTRLVDRWLAGDIAPDLSDLQDQAALSARQLTRKVKMLYGVPPKYLARKYRALKAARLLADQRSDKLDYLRDAFYDQSHMIREIKLFTGITPARLRGAEGGLQDMIDQRARLSGIISPLTSQT